MAGEYPSTPESLRQSEIPKVLLLVGGKGTRLASVTNGLSKGRVTIDRDGSVSGVDHAHEIFTSLRFTDVALLAKNYADQYDEFAAQNAYEMVRQEGNSGTGGALEEAFARFGVDQQYLVMSADTYLSAEDVARLAAAHTPGTVTWGVSPHRSDLMMDSYHGLVVNECNQVLGDISQPWWQGCDTSKMRLYTKGAIQIIDPKLYMRTARLFKRLAGSPKSTDLYWDVMPLMEEQNRRRLLRGQTSIMNAVVFEDDLIDYGTPERLALTRERYNPDYTRR